MLEAILYGVIFATIATSLVLATILYVDSLLRTSESPDPDDV